MPRKSQGFTLIELLVVVAILAVLASLLLSALATAKRSAQRAICMNNLKQIQLAWQIYPQDYSGRLVINGLGEILPAPAPMLGNWVMGLMGHNDTPQAGNLESTNTLYLTGMREALFSPYITDPRLYKCPADRGTVLKQGRRLPRVRSYSLQVYLGSYINRILPFQEMGYKWVDQPDLYSKPGKRFYDLDGDIAARNAENIWTFIDEQEDSIYAPEFRGYYADYGDGDWIGIPTSRHNGSGVLAFADGHVETKRWVARSTKRPLTGILQTGYPPMEPGNIDKKWLDQRAPPAMGY